MWIFIGVIFFIIVYFMTATKLTKRWLAERAEKKVTKNSLETKRQMKAKIKSDICDLINKSFFDLNWNNWDLTVHELDSQYKIIEDAYYKSDTMKLLACNPDEGTSTVCGSNGMIYEITEEGCSCPAFIKNMLPCKHMYYVAMNYED